MLGHTYVHLLAPACTRLHLLAPAHTFRTRAGVRTCEFSHIRTFTHISKNFFAKQNSGSHTMHVAHILHACGCADVRNFAHPHFHTHIQKNFCKKKLWQPHHAHCTHFASVRVCGRAKFRTSALSHTFPILFIFASLCAMKRMSFCFIFNFLHQGNIGIPENRLFLVNDNQNFSKNVFDCLLIINEYPNLDHSI